MNLQAKSLSTLSGTPVISGHRNILRILSLACCCFAAAHFSLAQAPFPPPNQIQVFSFQGLSFGSFYTGSSGGTVVISPNGTRSTTGTVLGLSSDPGYPAIFNVRLVPGRLVSISIGPDVTLTRVGGGGSMTMSIGPTDKGASFVTTGGHPFVNPVSVGGTLYVGNMSANPAGSYEGTFSVTFIQE